jgi:hypothetical protein
MPRHRRGAKAVRVVPRSVAPVPQRYLLWMELTGIEAALATRLWDALTYSGHATARRLTWFFHRLETRSGATIAAQMAGFNQALSPQQWVALLEVCVRQERLSRGEANDITEALLRWVQADGGWRYSPPPDRGPEQAVEP